MAVQDQTKKICDNTLLLFGALALSPDASTLSHLRAVVLEHEDNTWMIDLIRTLLQDCETALSQLPFLHQATVSTTRRSLSDVVTDFCSVGSFANIIFPLPNAVLIPLAVITQLAQYANFKRQSQTGLGGVKETLGLCTGLLGAFAVASADDDVDFRKYGAAAARLGMLVGLVVDSEDAAANKGRYRSVSAAWNSEDKYAAMLSIMRSFDEAYISVYYDRDRATITTNADTASNLTRRLQSAGLTASEIGLYGRFHSLGNNKLRGTLVDHLLDFCDSDAGAKFRLPDACSIPLATRANDRSGSLVTQGPLHAHALRSILLEPAEWFETFSATINQASLGSTRERVQIVDFGPRSAVPPSLASTVDVTIGTGNPKGTKPPADLSVRSEHGRTWSDSDIAVVGMACKVPGADNLEDFWDLLLSGQSQHRELNGDPSAGAHEDRFNFEDSLFRSAAGGEHGTAKAEGRRRWFANLVDGHDQFDHRFFKKSARESASMDPQQRHILQVAYQAVEQSGYFNRPSPASSSHREPHGDHKEIGCFVGLCLGDYDSNVASHPANAFTATGNLQGFVSGKISHFFGWTGPAVTINTACSSSLVAVHQASQAILSGECEAALAGGTHIMTSATWFQNLAGGSFLSPTGPCKPFDARADGYCRGEGVGAVYLKKMSRAVADGDQILGVIAATGVQQNQNCTPIFVPNGPSLESLFTRVMAKARVKPSHISVVEAHGTGTAVGDPAEYDGIRKALGGSVHRGPDQPLMVSSVKGLVGHMECASGIISLIKILLMVNKGTLPPQANFKTINPALHATPADYMFIPTRPEPWVVPQGGFRAALINNYGASGSNASAVIVQPPSPEPELVTAIGSPDGVKYPFWLTASDKKSLSRYVGALQSFLKRSSRSLSLASLSFNLAYQSNRTFDASLVFTARSVGDLEQNLSSYETDSDTSVSKATSNSSKGPTKVVLCFGGQVSSHIGLDRQVYESIALLRHHLDQVDAVIQNLGFPSIFPGIFDRMPPANVDTVHLQTMLFSIQYACARCWMDSGVKPTAVVGHSFGTLTALCISGILSVEDTLKVIVRRATLVRDAWGPDKGAMMAVEADLDSVKRLLDDANKNHTDEPATIACYNGPRSFTLAGPVAAMEAVSEQLEKGKAMYGTLKAKRLHVTNAFHSVLVDPLYEQLEQSAASSGVTFRKPTIPIELTTEQSTSASDLTGRFVADHMRDPVYFHHAVERLARRCAEGSSSSEALPDCVFLEAGTNSTVTTMAARAMANVNLGTNAPLLSFPGVNIANCDDGWNKLTDTTMALWKAGVRVQHWAHHGTQPRYQTEIKPLFLPPYQFDPESRHWMDLKVPPKALPAPVGEDARDGTSKDSDKRPDKILTFIGFQDGVEQKQARFHVNTSLDKYKQLLQGHLTLQTAPILSATLQISLVIEAVSGIDHEYEASNRQPQIQDVEYQSPVCYNSARSTWIEVTKASDGLQASSKWYFEVFSTTGDSNTTRMLHTKGYVAFREPEDVDLRRELVRYERLFSHARALDLLQNTASAKPVDEILGNRSIYRIFSEIVDYGAEFRGLQKMVCRGDETAGHVVNLKDGNTTAAATGMKSAGPWFDPHLADTFCQLGGLYANCVAAERGGSHVYLANGIDQWIRRHVPSSDQAEKRPAAFDVFAVHHQASEQLLLTDVFVFDAAGGTLVEVILGIAYVKIARPSMEKLLIRLTEPSWVAAGKAKSSPTTTLDTQVPPVSTSTNVKMHSAANDLPPSNAQQPNGVIHPQETSETQSSKPTDKSGELQDLITRVKAVIADLSGLEIAEIKDDSDLADLGIDSLAGMEMRNEIESTLKVELPDSEIVSVVDMQGLLRCVAGAMGLRMSGASISTADSQPSAFQGPRQTDELIQSSDSDTPSVTSDNSDGVVALTNTSSLSTPFPEILSDLDKDEGQPCLPFDTVQRAFAQMKKQTDTRISEAGQASYSSTVLPRQDELAVLLTIEALEALGAGFRSARPGEQLARIPHAAEHERFVTYMYKQLETATQIIKIDGRGPQAVITRTAVPVPDKKSSVALCEEMLRGHPDQVGTVELIAYAGEHLARVLTGETDGVKVIFGSKKGQELVSRWYAEWPLNKVLIAQMEEFFTQLATIIRQSHGHGGFSSENALRIMEMGAGTGGTTKRLVPLLARLGLPVVYTFTDLSPSFVAAARKKWGKEYPWMQFQVHNIEKTPSAADNPEEQYHFVVASNAIHATKSLRVSTGNVRKALRQDGFLMMMEMTRTPYWVDLIFGLFEGWWQFDDGREHALVHEARWDEDLSAVGYGYVDWTDGETGESEIQKVILAAACSSSRSERFPTPASLRRQLEIGKTTYFNAQATPDCKAREDMVVGYVSDLTRGFDQAMAQDADAHADADADFSQPRNIYQTGGGHDKCILITGGTGGLGAHLVAEAALRPDVSRVMCLNRPSKKRDAWPRQMDSLHKKGIHLPADVLAKITVFEIDLAQPRNLGLSDDNYRLLVDNTTHIIHNAWLMHSKWPVQRFVPQLRIHANMLNLAAHISARHRHQGRVVSFAFVSSIATVGYHPLHTRSPVVPEERMPIESVLPTGYGEAKYICERMLDATLHRHPASFRATAIRLGQIAGSRLNGHWNPMEHVSFLLKSSQTVGALPDLPGTMGWTPADDIARAMVEIVTQPDGDDNRVDLYPIYHIENPIRQPWAATLAVLAEEMGISPPREAGGVVPFQEWLSRVREWPRRGDNTPEGANPAHLMVDFLEDHFLRMSCGGLLMGTANAREHSSTLARTGPVSEDLIRLFVQSWKKTGFLS